MPRKNVAVAAVLAMGAVFAGAQYAAAKNANGARTIPIAAPMPSIPAASTRTISTSYRGSWNGFSALKVTLATTISPNGYSAKANLFPSGLTSITSHLQKSTTYVSQSRGGLSATGAPMPVQYIHQGGKKNRRVEVDYGPNDVKTTVTPDFGSYGDPPANLQQRLESVDTLSAIVALVNAEPANVCSRTLKIFDGRVRYNLTLSPLGTEKIKTDGYKGSALKCRVDYKRIAGYAKAKEGEKPLFDKPFTLWFASASNGLMAPVRVSIDSNWGPILLNLESMNATIS